MVYRMAARGFEQDRIEHIVRFSGERYFDTETRRTVWVGKHGSQDVLIPCEVDGRTVTPVTIHAVTRQQIRFRTLSGRFQDVK